MFLEGREIGDRTGHEAGRALLAQMYRRYVGDVLPELAVTDRGKPYFPGSSWHFSISHTKHYVFCALAEHPVGIDAEELDRQINLKLADKILSDRERIQYEAAADQRLALLTFWVLKEAWAKLTGEGLKGYPKHTEFSLTDPRVRQLQGCLVAVMEEKDNVI